MASGRVGKRAGGKWQVASGRVASGRVGGGVHEVNVRTLEAAGPDYLTDIYLFIYLFIQT